MRNCLFGLIALGAFGCAAADGEVDFDPLEETLPGVSEAPAMADDPSDLTEKQQDRRMCYFPVFMDFFERHTSDSCSDFTLQSNGVSVSGKNLPTGTTNGKSVDRSVCENFTQWDLASWGDVCDYLPSCEVGDCDRKSRDEMRAHMFSHTSADYPAVAIISVQDTNWAVDGGNGAGKGQNVKIWRNQDGNDNQRWLLKDVGDGWYMYKQTGVTSWAQGNYCMDGGGSNDNVHLWECDEDNHNQHWRPEEVPGGMPGIRNRANDEWLSGVKGLNTNVKVSSASGAGGYEIQYLSE